MKKAGKPKIKYGKEVSSVEAAAGDYEEEMLGFGCGSLALGGCGCGCPDYASGEAASHPTDEPGGRRNASNNTDEFPICPLCVDGLEEDFDLSGSTRNVAAQDDFQEVPDLDVPPPPLFTDGNGWPIEPPGLTATAATAARVTAATAARTAALAPTYNIPTSSVYD